MTPVDYGDLARRFLDAQLGFDRDEALRLLVEDGLGQGASVPDLLLQVVGAAQREIGRLWQENRISVADEHAATAIAQLVLAQLYAKAPRAEASGRTIVVACVEGERHDLGARIAADLLDLEGHDVQYLGADVPTDALVRVVTRDRPDLVVLSITMAFHGEALARAVGAIRREVPDPPPIAAGGAAIPLCRPLVESLHLVASGEEATTLVASVGRHFHN